MVTTVRMTFRAKEPQGRHRRLSASLPPLFHAGFFHRRQTLPECEPPGQRHWHTQGRMGPCSPTEPFLLHALPHSLSSIKKSVQYILLLVPHAPEVQPYQSSLALLSQDPSLSPECSPLKGPEDDIKGPKTTGSFIFPSKNKQKQITDH